MSTPATVKDATRSLVVDPSVNRTAKRLHDPTLSNRAFAISFIVTILIAIIFLLAPKAHAATITWDGGTSGGGTSWLTGTNWNPDTVPGANDIADFGSAGTSTGIGIDFTGATNNGAGNQAVGAIELLSTRSRTIGNSANNASGTLTLNGATVNGVANVILRNASTFTLTLQNSQGGNPNTTMDVALGNATNNIINIDGTGGITISSVIKNGAANANLTLNGAGGGILLFSGGGANTYSGTTSVNVSELDLGKTAGVDAIAGNLTIGDGVGAATTAIVKLVNSDQIANTSDVTINSDGVLNLNSKNETIDALNGSTGASVTLGTGTLTAGANNEGAANFHGVISGTGGGFIKTGTGTQILSGTNICTGDTQILSGDLRFDGGTSNNSTIRLGDTIANSPAATLSLGLTTVTNVASPLEVRASSSGTQGTRVLRSLSTSVTNTYSGAITMNADLTLQSSTGGTLLLQGGSVDVKNHVLSENSNLNGNGADTLSIQGTVIINEALTSSLATGGSLVKDGSGTPIIQSTSNNYTGTNVAALNANGTRIAGGILGIYGDGSLGLAPTAATDNIFFTASGLSSLVTGPTLQDTANNVTLAATRNINVASGVTGTFDSNGNTFTINGSINGSGGNIAKINSGTLKLNGNDTFTGTATINGGTLNAAANGALGSGTIGTSGITVTSGGTLMLSNAAAMDRVRNTAPIMLAGGTIGRSGIGTVSEGMGASRNGVTVTGTSTIGLGALSLTSKIGQARRTSPVLSLAWTEAMTA